MVAKIKTGRSIIGAINYNEHKVRSGNADLILAQGYLKEPSALSFSEKLYRLTDLTGRNERTLVNTLHVSLNFATSEHPDKETLVQIADDYMEGLGFGKQPYLVYEHFDAGHTHLHIVSTNIKPDGDRISFHLLAIKASEQARKQAEINYGLVKAEDQQGAQRPVKSLTLEKVAYGRSDTKRAITNVVTEVLRTYKFTSIPELNSVLNGFNVMADRGSRDSTMYEQHGLVYWVMDDSGQKVGVPIKASSIYGKPTMKRFEQRFALNEVLRRSCKEQLKNTIDNVLLTSESEAEFQQKLKEHHVAVVFRHSDDARLYGVTFIDHKAKVVFNGSDLGKNYSANHLSRCFSESSRQGAPTKHKVSVNSFEVHPRGIPDRTPLTGSSPLTEALFQEDKQDMAAVGRLQRRKRRKKRAGHSL